MSSIATAPYTYGKDGHMTGFTDDTTLFPVEGIAVEESFQPANKPDENKKRPREGDDEEKCPAKEPKRPRSTSAEPILPTTQSADEVVPDIWADLVSFQETVVYPAVKLLEGLEKQNKEIDHQLLRKLTRANSEPLPSKRLVLEQQVKESTFLPEGKKKELLKELEEPKKGDYDPAKAVEANLARLTHEYNELHAPYDRKLAAYAKEKPEPKRPELPWCSYEDYCNPVCQKHEGGFIGGGWHKQVGYPQGCLCALKAYCHFHGIPFEIPAKKKPEPKRPEAKKPPAETSPAMRLAEIVKGMNIPQDTKLTTFMLQLAKRKIKAPKKEVDRCCAFLLARP